MAWATGVARFILWAIILASWTRYTNLQGLLFDSGRSRGRPAHLYRRGTREIAANLCQWKGPGGQTRVTRRRRTVGPSDSCRLPNRTGASTPPAISPNRNPPSPRRRGIPKPVPGFFTHRQEATESMISVSPPALALSRPVQTRSPAARRQAATKRCGARPRCTLLPKTPPPTPSDTDAGAEPTIRGPARTSAGRSWCLCAGSSL